MEGNPGDLRSATSKDSSRAQSESRRSSRHPQPSLVRLKAEVAANRKAITALLGEDCGQYESLEKVRAGAQNLKKRKGDFQRASITLVEKLTAIGSLEEASEELNDRNDLLNQVGLGLAKLAQKKSQLGGSELSLSEASQTSVSPSEVERQLLYRTLKENEAEDEVQSKIEELELQCRELQIRQESQSKIEQERLRIRKQALEREKIKRVTLAALNATNDSDPDLQLPVETDVERMVRFQGPKNTRNPSNPFNNFTLPNITAGNYNYPDNLSTRDIGDSNREQNNAVACNTRPEDFEPIDVPKFTMGRVDPTRFDSNACVQPFSPKLDATTRYLGKMEFFRSSPTPFVGKASHFTMWRESFLAEARELELSPREMIRALQSHTGGEALRVVENFRDAGGMNPEATIGGIWEALAKRFGTSSRVTAHLVNQVNNFQEIGTTNVASKLQDLCDLCRQIGGQMSSVPGLRHFDTEIGIRSIANKLPGYIFNRWRRRGCSYEEENGGLSPPFSVFLEFLSKETDWANNPAYIQSRRPATETPRPSRPIRNDNLSFSPQRTLTTCIDIKKSCPLHKSGNHGLEGCQLFHSMGINSKEDVIRRNGLCFRCLGPHKRVDCPSDISCTKCSSRGHISALHSDDKNGDDRKELTRHQDYKSPNVNTRPRIAIRIRKNISDSVMVKRFPIR